MGGQEARTKQEAGGKRQEQTRSPVPRAMMEEGERQGAKDKSKARQERRGKNQEPSAKSPEPRANSQELAKSQDARAKTQEQIDESQEARPSKMQEARARANKKTGAKS